MWSKESFLLVDIYSLQSPRKNTLERECWRAQKEKKGRMSSHIEMQVTSGWRMHSFAFVKLVLKEFSKLFSLGDFYLDKGLFPGYCQASYRTFGHLSYSYYSLVNIDISPLGVSHFGC